jgi:hydroxymethylbilane synthase
LSALRVGTRGSALALAQARWVTERIAEATELVTITTEGDRDRAAGDKSRWTGALELALQRGEIDLAVHSAKDVPGELGEGLALVAAPPRESWADVLVGVATLDDLPAGARVGTSALRRRAQLLAVRPDLELIELRGNVDTRLR